MASSKKPTTLMAAIRFFDPETASDYIQSIKWPEGPVCPKCGSVNIGHIKSRNRYQCREKECRRQFSVTTGTIFEGTHLRLDQWIAAVWMIANCRNGVSSCEIARTIGCKQQSAWHLLHRVRHVMQETNDRRMQGTVEADSTLVGGMVNKMPKHRRAKWENKWGKLNKSVVHAFRERDTGRIRADVIPVESRPNVAGLIDEQIEQGSSIHTDEAKVYLWLAKSPYKHESINHGREEYRRGDVTTNGVENFFSCLRRSLKGTYIRPTKEHLQAYVDEATFRFNVRDMSEWHRFDAAMREIVGKRLTYKELTNGAVR